MTRYLSLLLSLLLFASCAGRKFGCHRDEVFAWSVQQKFFFLTPGFDPTKFSDPLQNHAWTADSLGFMRSIAFEMQWRGLDVTDGLFGGVLALNVIKNRKGTAEPAYAENMPKKWPKLKDIPTGAWVLDIQSWDKKTLLMRAWAMPEQGDKPNEIIDQIKRTAQRICACYPR